MPSAASAACAVPPAPSTTAERGPATPPSRNAAAIPATSVLYAVHRSREHERVRRADGRGQRVDGVGHGERGPLQRHGQRQPGPVRPEPGDQRRQLGLAAVDRAVLPVQPQLPVRRRVQHRGQRVPDRPAEDRGPHQPYSKKPRPLLRPSRPGLDHPQQQRRRGVERLLELLVHRDGDGGGGVQADEVGERERSHRVVGAADHRGVDVLGRGHAGLDHPDRGQQVRHQQGVDHEAGPVLAEHGLLAQPVLGERPAPCPQWIGAVSSDGTSSTSGSTGTGLKKCMPSTRSGRARDRGQPGDRDGGGVAGQHAVRPDDPAELAVERGLGRLVLDDGLDHQVPVGQVVELGGGARAAAAPRPGPPGTSLPRVTARSSEAATRSRPAVGQLRRRPRGPARRSRRGPPPPRCPRP